MKNSTHLFFLYPFPFTFADITVFRVGTVVASLASVTLVAGTTEVIDTVLALAVLTWLSVTLVDVIVTVITTEPGQTVTPVLVDSVNTSGVVSTLVINTVVWREGLQLIVIHSII